MIKTETEITVDQIREIAEITFIPYKIPKEKLDYFASVVKILLEEKVKRVENIIN